MVVHFYNKQWRNCFLVSLWIAYFTPLQGYATILNDDGSPLTSFQKHLLALARAIIRKPRILLWEEDLSVMDSSALNVLTNYLDQVRTHFSAKKEAPMFKCQKTGPIRKKYRLDFLLPFECDYVNIEWLHVRTFVNFYHFYVVTL